MGRDSRATSLARRSDTVKGSRTQVAQSTFARRLSDRRADAHLLLTLSRDPRVQLLGSLLDAKRRGAVRAMRGDDDADAVAARIEQEIRSHPPVSVQRDGCRIYFRGSMRTSSLNPLGGCRGMVEVSTTDDAREARYELDFTRHRILLAVLVVVFVVVRALWIAVRVFVPDDGPISLDVAIQMVFEVIFGIPAMGILLFNVSKVGTGQSFERLLRRALYG